MRSYCLYNGDYVDISEIYEIREGKQINIPEKLKYYRHISDRRQLFCSCGCGEVVILVAGEKNIRKQHFRRLREFVNSNCEYQEESGISVKSKIILKCWLNKNLPEAEHKIKYRVPISQLTENNRKYELTMYSEDYDVGIIYNKFTSGILEEKVELLSEYMKSKIIYVTRIENEKTDGQYPEHMMRIQETQGYCFYLDLSEETLYEEVEAKVSIYERSYRGLWEVIDICHGMLDDFGVNENGLLVYKGKLISELVEIRRENFKIEQKNELEKLRKQEEEERLRQERARLERAERERMRQERERKEREDRERQEEENRRKKLLEQEEERKERQRRIEEKQKIFLEKYPKYKKIYNLLKALKCIQGLFDSDQSNGKTKSYSVELVIDKITINTERHRIEVSDNKFQRVYIYILENDFKNAKVPGTGALYKILDYTRIEDVENSFRTALNCIYKDGYNEIECSFPDINCQFLGVNNVCPYQKR